MTNEEKDKKEYEFAVLLKNEGDLTGVLALVSQHKIELIAEPRAKNLAFAYEVEGQKNGVFAYCGLRAFGDEIKGLEKDLTSRQDVLRFLLIASPPPAEKISPMMSAAMPRRGKPMRSAPPAETKPAASRPLSNEALEKKIEEILK